MRNSMHFIITNPLLMGEHAMFGSDNYDAEIISYVFSCMVMQCIYYTQSVIEADLVIMQRKTYILSTFNESLLDF